MWSKVGHVQRIIPANVSLLHTRTDICCLRAALAARQQETTLQLSTMTGLERSGPGIYGGLQAGSMTGWNDEQ